MPKTVVNKSVTIQADAASIFTFISDYHNWKSWSPWLIMEPEAKVTVQPDGKFYEWKGGRTGSGSMRIVNEKPNSQLDMDLTFLTPWKSLAKVSFTLLPHDHHTHVIWTMESSLPLLLFWMKKSMEAFIGMDFERGLSMLKEKIENGHVASELQFLGEQSFQTLQYIGITTTCRIEEIGTRMEADFDKIRNFIHLQNNAQPGRWFSQYHIWDVVKGEVKYTSGVEIHVHSDLPSGFVKGVLASTRVHTVRLKGSYRHLGNAWATANSMLRNKEFKPVKGYHPFELYVNSPSEVSENELLTDVNFAVKS